MSNLADRVRRLSRRLLVPALAAATLSSGCDTILGPKNKNEAPETVIRGLTYSVPDLDELQFLALGVDKEDEFTRRIDFRVKNNEFISEWHTSYTGHISIDLTPLSEGEYTLEVMAIDSEGLPDPTPEERTFRVRHKNAFPDTTLIPIYENGIIKNFRLETIDGDGYGTDYKVSLEGPKSQDWGYLEESLDIVKDLPDGNYTIRASAIDNKGEEDPTPAEFEFNVDKGLLYRGHRTDFSQEPLSPEPRLITEPIEILPDNTRVFQGSTNGNVASFLDETSEDGKAEVEVINQNHQREAMDVEYFDNPNFKLFTAVDPNDNLAETMLIAPHNSLHTLRTAPKNMGRVLMQVINDEETTRAWYRFETNPQLKSNPFRRYEYTETIDEDERVQKRDKNLTWIRRVDKVNGFIGSLWSSEFPFTFEELAPYFDPYVSRDDVQARRWDVYRRSYGTEFTPERIEDIILIPSNAPKVEISSLVKHNYNTTIFWTASDDTVYSMPFDLPDVIDLTTLLGPTLETDLHLDYTLQKNNEIIEQGNSQEERDEFGRETGRVFAVFSDLQEGNYTFIGQATDEVENTSADTLNFRIEEEATLPETPVEEPEAVQDYDLSDKIVFSGTLREWNSGTYASLFIMSPDGSNIERLTEYNNFIYPRWSPSGDRIAFITSGGDNDLYLMDMKTRELARLSATIERFSWSPDGNRVAYTSNGENSGSSRDDKICIVDLYGNQTTLIEGLSSTNDFDWSSYNTIIAGGFYMGKPGLFSIDANSGDITNLTEDRGGFYLEPRWSPNGDKIAFVHNLGGDCSIGVMDPNGDNERMLTDRVYDWSPSSELEWSPNGNKIAFSTKEKSLREYYLYVIDPISENGIRRLFVSSYGSFSWSPDGRKIVFSNSGNLNIINEDGSDNNPTASSSEYYYDSPSWSKN
ncbi:PD40 domain-containing protein [Candidatus Woesearchaeota archaeon]|nr:PD40 domain-containing protein [Candidatus Woesearchaeota archaeon]